MGLIRERREQVRKIGMNLIQLFLVECWAFILELCHSGGKEAGRGGEKDYGGRGEN